MKGEKHHFSEPVQEIMGTIPSWITRWGVTVLLLVLALILIGCCFVRYPRTMSCPVTVSVSTSSSAAVVGVMNVPSHGFGKVRLGQEVIVRLNAFPYMEYGILRGLITDISSIPEKAADGSLCYQVKVSFPDGLTSTYGTEIPPILQMDGLARIITDDMRLIEHFITPIKSLNRNR